MTEQLNTTPEDKERKPDAGAPVKDVQVKTTFHRYDSLFTQLVAPLIATRYFWLALEDINPGNFLRKPKPELRPDFVPWQKVKFTETLRRNFAALGMGLTFLTIIGTYSRNTLHDIKSLYAEAVGFELGKKKEDVTYGDVFFRSNNEAIKVTCKAYMKRTAARIATAATFFIPWHKFRDFKNDKPKYDANANAGVGAIGIYLFGEGFVREPSFFDAEQSLVINAVHHTNMRAYESIQPKNIQTLLMLQRKHMNKQYTWPDVGSEGGQRDLQLATRISELMNKTYLNTPNDESASFTLGKFNYLVGFGMLNRFPESLAFVELANKSSDMKDVNNAADALKKGQDAKTVFSQFGIDVDALSGQPKVVGNSLSSQSAPAVSQEAALPSIAAPAAKSFANTIGKSDTKPAQARSHTEFAEQTQNGTLGV